MLLSAGSDCDQIGFYELSFTLKMRIEGQCYSPSSKLNCVVSTQFQYVHTILKSVLLVGAMGFCFKGILCHLGFGATETFVTRPCHLGFLPFTFM